MRFHILGLGPIGSLVAHHLRSVLPRGHPITLIHKTKRLAALVNASQGAFKVETHGVVTTASGFDSEVFDEEELHKGPTKSFREQAGLTINMPERELDPMHKVDPLHKIESLIITTKAHSTVPAVQRLLPRLSADSTIVLLQNGLGVYEQLCQDFFRNPRSRPHFILASNTHGAWAKAFNTIVHAGQGAIEFGIVPDPRERDFEANLRDESIPKLERQLRIDDIGQPTNDLDYEHYRSLRLTVAALSAMESLHTQWKSINNIQVAMRRKLVVNAVINPLTALMGCRNGDLFSTEGSRRIAKRVCREAAGAYTSELKHATRSYLEDIGDPQNEGEMTIRRLPRVLEWNMLEDEVYRVAELTKGNLSSMLVDVRQGKRTEIDFLNGYLLRLGKAHGYNMPTNAMLIDLMRMRSSIPLDQML